MTALNNETQDRLSHLIGGYQPLPGVADELLDPDGNLRPAWRNFVRYLADMDDEEIHQRFRRGNQYLKDAGVFYRQYDEEGSTERDWPLSHIPILIEENDWRHIERGLIQRAHLLERVVSDIYGQNRLIADGYLPAEIVAQSPEWLRPLIGVEPRLGHYLNFVAFEIGRGPDGTWWVLGDRTQAPSGAGFALENRVATSRVFSDFYSDHNIHRLAGFFKTFRDVLNAMSDHEDSRVGILTPGRLNDTYFEHAYIARYLGFMLLEGEDLLVQNGRLMVRTVSGLKPISVLWRRLDASFADPLELNEHSRLGTPGLLEAVRQGNVSLVNALGTGILQSRALMAFWPRISEALLNETLLMPNIATWWCGQETERQHVLNNVDKMMIGSARSSALPFDIDQDSFSGRGLTYEEHQNFKSKLEREGGLYVGHEAVTLSTTPAYANGKLIPRPMSIRVFAARTPMGWKVMPGGYARVGQSDDATAVAMQRGGSVADVWIVSSKPVQTDSMLQGEEEKFFRNPAEILPSRAADNLFWLGRYIERAETNIRLNRTYHVRLAESQNSKEPLLENFADYLKIYGVDEPLKGIPNSLCETINSALISAGHVRDRFSPDGWMALNELYTSAAAKLGETVPGDDCARELNVLLRMATGFSGLVHESMYHYTGWRFLNIGRALERAYAMSSLLAYFISEDAPEGAVDLAVEVGESAMVHRRRYTVTSNRNTAIDLLALDALNPRSIIHQLNDFREHLTYLPNATDFGHMSELARAALDAHARLATRSPEELDEPFFLEMCDRINRLTGLLSVKYMK